MIQQKPTEYWIGVIAVALYVVTRNAEADPILKRIVKTVVSGGLTVSLSPTIADYIHANETWAAVIIMAIGFMVLDVFTMTVGNRKFLQSIIRNRIAGATKDDDKS